MYALSYLLNGVAHGQLLVSCVLSVDPWHKRDK